MASTKLITTSLVALHHAGQLDLLDEIDRLRHLGIGTVSYLPQLVVCGDQSSGKSSISEAISGVPFPQNDNLCTRFATELILRKSLRKSVYVQIVPNQNRPEHERQSLRDFRYILRTFEQLPSLIDKAKVAMGLNGVQRAFSTDILRIEISGPSYHHLTVVDLPGLIYSENKAQTEADTEIVSSLVQSYLQCSRSIIIAVVSAQNDYANQVILEQARAFDPYGLRTIGLITKPDTLPPGSDREAAIIQMAMNGSIRCGLGWHVLKNRDHLSRNALASERDLAEECFFSQGIWKGVPRSIVGLSQLRSRLGRVVMNHIQLELPSLIVEIKESLDESRLRLANMGDSRESSEEKRLFLRKLSQSFDTLCKASHNGNYEETFFEDALSQRGRSKRLRATIQKQSIKSAARLGQQGNQYHIADDANVSGGGRKCADITLKHIATSEAMICAPELYTNLRGTRLPSIFNPLLIGDLFCLQSKPWEQMSRHHLDLIWTESEAFFERLLSELTDDDTRNALLEDWIDPAMEGIKKHANDRLANLFCDRQRHATTYNHYFTYNVQRARELRRHQSLKTSLERLLSVTHCRTCGDNRFTVVDLSALVASLESETELDMDNFACNELLHYMIAFYKVAMTMFVDKISIQVIEALIVSSIPELLSPATVAQVEDTLMNRIATESHADGEIRESLACKIQKLENGIEACKRYSGHSVTAVAILISDTKIDEEASTDCSDTDVEPTTRLLYVISVTDHFCQ